MFARLIRSREEISVSHLCQLSWQVLLVAGCSFDVGPLTRDADRDEADRQAEDGRDWAGDEGTAEGKEPGEEPDEKPDVGGEEREAPEDALDGPSDSEGEEAVPLPRFPIIFVHGHRGGVEDWRDTVDWLVENDARWSGCHEAGTASYQEWEPGSIPPAEWLFNFTYYNRKPEDDKGDFSAGPGKIGSNGDYLCGRLDEPGYLPTDTDAYYQGVDHEYAGDLGDFVDAVLLATGAEKVDMAAHSMGGLVARSMIQFYGGFAKVRRLMLVSSPIHGIALMDLGFLDPTAPRWMLDHEFAEMDDAVSFWDIGFYTCAIEGPAGPWHAGLNRTDEEAAGAVTYCVVLGGSDPLFSLEDVTYDHAEWEVVVPGEDHNSVRSCPETLQRITEYLGN